MSEALNRAFEAALISSVAPADPMSGLTLIGIAGFAATVRDRITSSLMSENDRWSKQQADMRSNGIGDDSAEWKSGLELHDLIMDMAKNELLNLQKIAAA